jgi:hypothetical protein
MKTRTLAMLTILAALTGTGLPELEEAFRFATPKAPTVLVTVPGIEGDDNV